MIKIAFLGNPNVGKSSLFNSLSGQRQKVANWPGKTIECKKGVCTFGNEKIELFDLPGTYSLSPFSDDEKIVEETLKQIEFDALIQVVDSSNIERNLYLTLEILERTNKLVVALNMEDVALKKGLVIDESKLSDIFGVEFVKIDARHHKGFDALLEKVILVSKKKEVKKQPIQVHAELVKKRYEKIQQAVNFSVSGFSNHQIGLLDKLALNQFSGLVIFFAIMYFLFHLTFFLSSPISEFFNNMWMLQSNFILELIREFPDWLVSLIQDGILGGVGSVISFFPQIAVMMFLLYFLEDSGYLARAVVVLDAILKKFGLGGKAFIPLLLGFGCNVPAIFATRIINDGKTKLTTILSIPFISCSARLPVYVLFAGVFFKGAEADVIFFIYILGFLVAIFSALLFKKLLKKADDELIIELPKYHFPHAKNLVVETINSVKDFAERAGSIILITSIGIWFLSNLPYGVEYGSENSFAGTIGKTIAPLFSPLGFKSWQAGLAIFNGMIAKEVVISTFATTYGSEFLALQNDFTKASSLSFMVFVLLYVPCFAVVGAIKSETKSWKLTFLAIAYYLLVAYAIAYIVYNLGSLWI